VKRFVLAVLVLAGVGLGVVYGEVEAVRLGYRVRQLNIEKTRLVSAQKKFELDVARLRTPQRLEEWMAAHDVRLGQSETRVLARVHPVERRPAEAPLGRFHPVRLARLVLGLRTAQADTQP
jgi:hypothetical protein